MALDMSPQPVAEPGSPALGCQAIVDRRGELAGCELLYRGGDRTASNSGATADVVRKFLGGAGFSEPLARVRASINVNADFLHSDAVDQLPPRRTVLEILETVDATPELMARIEVLRARGFAFVLDDVTVVHCGNAPFLQVIEYAKVDVLAVPEKLLAPLVRGLRTHAGALLAEKVESAATFERCRALGFELFQGYYIAAPQLLTGRRAEPPCLTGAMPGQSNNRH